MLVDDLRTVINASWNTSMGSGKTKEPELAAAFLNKLLSQPVVDEIARALAGSLPADTTLVVRGIFAHQNPYANFTDSANMEGKSELADLILLREHVDDKGSAKKKGFLIQAKSKEQPNTGPITDPKEIRQFELYAYWEKFNLTETFLRDYKAFSPPAGKLDFATGYDSQQSRYGIVANREASVLASAPWGNDCAWVICKDTFKNPHFPASVGAVFEDSMDNVLQQFFNFSWGREYGEAFAGDWTLCLEFLTRLVKAAKFKHSLVQRRVKESSARVRMFTWQAGSTSLITNKAGINGPEFYRYLKKLDWLSLPPDGWEPSPLDGSYGFPVSILYIGTASNRPWSHD